MGAPNIPDRTQEQSVTDILETVALQQSALATLINSEAEKIQAATNKLDHEEMIELQQAVRKVLVVAIKNEMLLQFKLEEVFNFKEEAEFPSES